MMTVGRPRARAARAYDFIFSYCCCVVHARARGVHARICTNL
jgi:hypothetical protein